MNRCRVRVTEPVGCGLFCAEVDQFVIGRAQDQRAELGLDSFNGG
jgi:hypothetical protein